MNATIECCAVNHLGEQVVFCKDLPDLMLHNTRCTVQAYPVSDCMTLGGAFEPYVDPYYTYSGDDLTELRHDRVDGDGYAPDTSVLTDEDSGSTRYYGVMTHTLEPEIIISTMGISGVEAGDKLAIELRASIRVPSSELAPDGRYRGTEVLSERVIVDIHIGTFSVTVR